MTAALHARPAVERRERARRLQGRPVRITYDGFRCAADAKVLEGELVSVAIPYTGGGADLVTIRRPGMYDVAISLATVISLEEVNAT